MFFQSSENASTMLCLLISAVVETCECGSGKESAEDISLRNLSVQLVIRRLHQSRENEI